MGFQVFNFPFFTFYRFFVSVLLFFLHNQIGRKMVGAGGHLGVH